MASGYKDIWVTSYDTLRFSWWENYQVTETNATNVGWKLELIAGSAGAISSSYAKSWWVNINGSYYEGTNYISIDNNETKLLASGDTAVVHNADGTKSFSYSFAQYFGINFAGVDIKSISGSGTGTLTTIPRSAILTDADNFNDEFVVVSIKYSNPAGSSATSLQACIASTNGQTIYVPYREVSKTDGRYNFILSDSEKRALRKAVTSGNSTTVAFYLYSDVGGHTNYSVLNRTFTIHGGTPQIGGIDLYDTNTSAIALTGDRNVMIKHYNNIYMKMSPTARKDATIVKNYCKCGEEYVEGNWAYWDNATSNYFKFTTVDSRGNQTSVERTLPMVEYIPLTANIEADITLDTIDGTKATLEFTVSGNYFNGSFGAKDNTLALEYTLDDGSDNPRVAQTLEIPEGAISGNTYRVSHTITNLDYKGSYIITVQASDKVNYHVYATSKTLKATPVFDWGENDFNFNVPVAINNVEVDYPVEQGVKDGWYYRKWNSGLAECCKTMSVSGIDMGEFNMNGFYYCGSKGVNFPFTFKELYYANATGGSTGNMNIIRPFGVFNTGMTYVLMGNADISSATATVNLEAKGTWK